MLADRLILWLSKEGWIGLVPMLSAALWCVVEASKLRRDRRRFKEMVDRYCEARRLERGNDEADLRHRDGRD